MMQTDDRSLKGLVADLGSNIATLFRKEIQLARAETAEKIGQAGTAVASIAAGGILALAALLVLLQALVVAIAEAGVPPAVAALIVGAVVALIAYVWSTKVCAISRPAASHPTGRSMPSSGTRTSSRSNCHDQPAQRLCPGDRSRLEVAGRARARGRAKAAPMSSVPWTRSRTACRPGSWSTR